MNYPTLNVKNLKALVAIVEEAARDQSYLDPEVCPYDEATIQLIRRVIQVSDGVSEIARATVPARGKVGRPTKGPAIPLDEVETEVNEIRQELASLKIDGQTMETSDRIQVIKTRAALIERVISMKERIADVKRFHDFVRVVVGIMEEHLDPKIRDSVMEELKGYVEV
jgi:hypothetical protein